MYKSKQRSNIPLDGFVKFSCYKTKWRSIFSLTTLNSSFVKNPVDRLLFLWKSLNTSLLAKPRELECSALKYYDKHVLGRTNIKKHVHICNRKKYTYVLTKQRSSMYINKRDVFDIPLWIYYKLNWFYIIYISIIQRFNTESKKHPICTFMSV